MEDAKLNANKTSEAAKTKVEVERLAGQQMRDASLKNMVRREEMVDLGSLESAMVRERQGQRKRCGRRQS